MRARLSLLTKPPDYTILVILVALLTVGLLAVYSASFAYAIGRFGDPTYYVVRQALWVGLGTILLLSLVRLDYWRLRRWSPWLMLLSLAILGLTLVPGLGLEVNGARRWLSLGPLPPVQPSEFMKLTLILYISAWLASRRERLNSFGSAVVPFVLMVGLVGGMVLLQPDLGTAILIILVALTVFFVAGAPLRYFALLIFSGAVALVPLIFQVGYRADRMQSFFDPWGDPQGKGFHIIQSLIALGSGGITGLGIGASRQKFYYVPGSHTDAIFAIVGEEMGLVGAFLVMFLLGALVYRGIRLVFAAQDDFGALLALGISVWFAYQALINIGGITRTIPFTGITLPFISYGGSSLAASMAAVGLLLSVSRFRLTEEERRRAGLARSARSHREPAPTAAGPAAVGSR